MEVRVLPPQLDEQVTLAARSDMGFFSKKIEVRVVTLMGIVFGSALIGALGLSIFQQLGG